MDQRRVISDDEALHRDVAHRMKTLTGKDSSSCGSVPRMATRDVSNPSFVLQSLYDSSIQAGTTHPKSNIVCDVNEGDFITELFGVSPATPIDIDTFTSDLESEKTDASVSGLQSIPHQDINVSEFFGVPFKNLVDIDNLTRDIKTVLTIRILQEVRVLAKEELTRILIWVKLHDVSIQVFEEDGISLIASFIGKLVMLDSYTSSMCNDSWGRSSFARCLIEVNSEADLVDVVNIGIPLLTRANFTKETIRVEYEWRPPRCDICKIFGHVHDQCPKKVASPLTVSTSNDVT
ncbi:zinc knuckle CX2CX4HX4C containing protein [Tanacetum coccineum]